MEDQSDPDPFSNIVQISSFIGESVLPYLLQGLLIAVLFTSVALVYAMEFAFNSLNNDNAESSKKSGLLSDKRITFLIINKKKFFISLLIFKNILILSLAICITGLWSKQPFISDHFLLTSSAFVILMSIFTAMCSDALPRATISNTFAFTRKTSLILLIIYKVFLPVTNFIIRLNSPKKKPSIKRKATEGGVGNIVNKEESSENTEDNQENNLTKSNLESLSLKKIMVNRLNIQAVDWELPFEEVLKEVNKNGFSRIPVFKDSIDTLEGILYVKDILIHLEEKQTFNWHNVIRPCFFIPDSKRIDELLKEFQEKKVHMAIVVDEYGGTAGLVTMEDILEEIVGDINDEFDQNHNLSYSTLDENTFIFEGNTPLTDLLSIQGIGLEGIKIDNEHGHTISAFLISQLSRLPQIGEQINFHKFEFTIIGIEDKTISRVKVNIKDQSNKKELV